MGDRLRPAPGSDFLGGEVSQRGRWPGGERLFEELVSGYGQVHERWFGLWGSDGSPKPAVREIQRFQGLPLVSQRLDLDWIDMDPEEFYTLPHQHLVRLYRRFCDRPG